MVHQKSNKDMVYTPMGGSPTIRVKVYVHFRGSHQLKVKPFTLVFNLIVKTFTQKIKNKSENMPV